MKNTFGKIYVSHDISYLYIMRYFRLRANEDEEKIELLRNFFERKYKQLYDKIL